MHFAEERPNGWSKGVLAKRDLNLIIKHNTAKVITICIT